VLIKKIISGGQTGADRAALDFAIKNDIPHGGWVPKDRIAEDGIIPKKYDVHEAPSKDYKRRTELNVINSDGTLIISHEELTGESALTKTLAEKHKKPCLYIKLDSMPAFKATIDITKWIKQHKIEILNVAGPKASGDPDIYDATLKILETVFLLRVIDDDVPDLIYKHHGIKDQSFEKNYPETVDKAVDKLISEMPLKDKVALAEMSEYDIDALHPSLGLYIRNKYGLWSGSPLFEACRELTGNKDLQVDEAPTFIIKKLWEKLRKTHRIRRV
jgi:hypothetical protein